MSYRDFVAPALLAASAMNGPLYESGNVFFKLNYAKTYEGVLATPLTVRDVALGELTYTLLRGTVYAVGFVAVMLVLGVVHSRVGDLRAARGAADLGRVRRRRRLLGDAHAELGRLRVRRGRDAADVPLLGDLRARRRVSRASSRGSCR